MVSFCLQCLKRIYFPFSHFMGDLHVLVCTWKLFKNLTFYDSWFLICLTVAGFLFSVVATGKVMLLIVSWVPVFHVVAVHLTVSFLDISQGICHFQSYQCSQKKKMTHPEQVHIFPDLFPVNPRSHENETLSWAIQSIFNHFQFRILTEISPRNRHSIAYQCTI